MTNTYCPICGTFHASITAGCTLKVAPVPNVPPLTPEQLEQIGREAIEWGKAIHERTRYMSAIGPDWEIEQLKERIKKLEQEQASRLNSDQLRYIRSMILNSSSRRSRDLKISLLCASTLATLEPLIRAADEREGHSAIHPSHPFTDFSEKIYRAKVSQLVEVIRSARELRNLIVSEAVDDHDQSKLDTVLKKVANLDKALKEFNDPSEMSDPR